MKYYKHPFIIIKLIIPLIATLLFSCNNLNEPKASDQTNDSVKTIVENKIKRLDSLTHMVNQFEKVSVIDINTISLEDKAKKIQNLMIGQCPSLSIASGTGENKLSRKYYIVEGDMMLDRDELYLYCQERLQNIDTNITTRKKANKLTVAKDPNDSLVIWEPGKILRYAIMRNSFSSKAVYNLVVKNFNEACKNWMQTCNIKFEYNPQFDNRDDIDLEFDTTTNLTFLVREINAGGKFIAKAFFPNDLPYKRTVLIDPSYFKTQADKVGIFRHELGHVIGWRHEHIWSKKLECQGENIVEDELGAKSLTEYDPYSVMHYICGEKLKSKDFSLSITEFDRIGAQKVYGPPEVIVAKK